MKAKKKIKKILKLHHPMTWPTRSTKEVCSECKVPYPCRTVQAVEGD